MTRPAFPLIFVLGLLAAQASSAAVTGPVRIDGGMVSGRSYADAVMAYHGLPYAAAPVGNLRWRAPAPVQPWQGVRKSEQPGMVCPQPQPGEPIPPQTPIGEDCLNVDVWTGAANASERRPVMVWFHGGERGFGAGSNPAFDGVALAKKGVVVVTVNYRGGPLGLLATPELSQESEHHVSGNYGLQDDIAALQWVQRNIAAFGGDPANVTIFGESFGAATCHFLSLSPLAKGLFHRMINQSHAFYPRDPMVMQVAAKYLPLRMAEADGLKFMETAGAKSLAELRAMPWQKLVEAYRKTSSQLLWTYVIDGYVVPRGYAATYAVQAQADVEVLVGENRDENGAAADTAFDLVSAGKAEKPGNSTAFLGLARYRDYVQARFGAMTEEYFRLYPATDDRTAFKSANAAIRDNQRISPWMWASAFTQNRSKPAYQYFFTHAPTGPNQEVTGVYHSADLRFVFNNPVPEWGSRDRKVADMMSSYWVNFARSGNPNGPGLPEWPAWSAKAEQVMELGDRSAPIPLSDPERLDFWRRFYATQPAR